MGRKKKVVVISCGQPSTSPRSVKEAISLCEAGYDVTYLYAFSVSWAFETDKEIVAKHPGIQWKMVQGSSFSGTLYYTYTRFRYKTFTMMSHLLSKSEYWHERAVTRCTPELKKEAKKIKADLYIAHNLGSLPAAAKAAESNSAAYAFDAEDYHWGESDDVHVKAHTEITENCYLRGTFYMSAASPLIARKYSERYPGLAPVVINNVFSLKLRPNFNALPIEKGAPLKLFWFSQTVGLDRGLQDIIQAMNTTTGFPVMLTLLGNCSDRVRNELQRLLNNNKHTIEFKSPVGETELMKESAHHHIGLALESVVQLNRDVCLTNKLFTYLLSGNAIVASATSAQKDFINTYNNIGALYEAGDAKQLSGILKDWYENTSKLNELRINAYELGGSKLNWEEEQKVFLNLVEHACQRRP